MDRETLKKIQRTFLRNRAAIVGLVVSLTVIVACGKPVRLNFRREETASCSDKVVFEHFSKSADLPTGELVAVELMPKEAGEFSFACPMGMFRGRLIVE